MRFKFLITLLCSFFIASCAKEDLETAFWSPRLNIYVAIENQIQNNLETDIKDNLLYNWDQNDGELYYSHGPSIVYGCIVEDGKNEIISKEFNVFSNNTVCADYRKQCDIYLFNKKNLVCNKSEIVGTFKFDNKFEPIEQCKEYYAGYVRGIKNSSIIVEMSPISYAYVFQFIIYNDDKSLEMNAESIIYMGVSGISKKFDLMEFKATNELGLIESFEVKNFQYCDDYGVVAERFLTFGLGEDSNSSWNIEDNNCELGVSIKMKDGSIKNGKANITKQLQNKPYGGVINIVIKNSEIVPKDEGQSIDIYVEEWDSHEIYLDF